jgi:tetratricopeptide (TPR) repeat protein
MNPACAEARTSVSDEALHLERVALHRTRCEDCRRHAERELEIRRSILAISERGLDDLSRARIQSRLAGEFDRMAAARARPKRVPRSLIAAVIATALILIYLWPREMVQPAIDAPRFRPFLVAGTREAQLAPTEVIEAGEGMIVRAAIDHGDVALIGPGRASMRDGILLESGTLVVRADRPLTIHGDAGRVIDASLEAEALAPPSEPSGIVVIDGTPAGAIAFLDGKVLGPIPLIARLSAGEHRLEVQADLHRSHAQVIAVSGGGIADISFVLDPLPKAPPKRAKPKPAQLEDAESLYRRAEQSLAAQRIEEAVTRLEDLIARFPDDPLVHSALYELARIDHQQGDLERAHGRLIRLLEKRRDFTEPGQRLLCEIDVETRRFDDANACWRSFRERFPSSVHDAEALASLIALAQVWNDCTRVKALAEEFLSKYPEHALVGDVRARLARCD